MPTSITVWDQSIPGGSSTSVSLELPDGVITLRDLIRWRILAEVRAAAEAPAVPRTRHSLTEAERLLNPDERPRRAPDPEEQIARALHAFRHNAFLVVVNDRQITDLEEPLSLAEAAEVRFLRLVPLIGG